MRSILDDRSRLACHVQWYLQETAESLVHGLGQAFQKRALPRANIWDNGAAMRAEEVLEGLRDLGIEARPTLPYSDGEAARQGGRIVGLLERLDREHSAQEREREPHDERRRHVEVGRERYGRFD